MLNLLWMNAMIACSFYIMKADCQSKLSAINHNLRVLFQYGGKMSLCGIVGYIGYDNAKELLLKV